MMRKTLRGLQLWKDGRGRLVWILVRSLCEQLSQVKLGWYTHENIQHTRLRIYVCPSSLSIFAVFLAQGHFRNVFR